MFDSLGVQGEIPRKIVDVQSVRGIPPRVLVPDDLQRFHLIGETIPKMSDVAKVSQVRATSIRAKVSR